MSNAQKKETVITLENVFIAMSRANDRWAKKEGQTGECEDIKIARKFWDDSLCVFVAGMLDRARIDQLTFLATVADQMGVKACKRVSEFFSCLHSKNYAKLDAVTALSILSAVHAGATSRSALIYATTGKGDESTSDIVKDISLVKKLQKVVKRVGSTSESSQNSRSFGVNGFCKFLNMGHMVKEKGKEAQLVVNAKSPFVIAIAKMVEQASDDTLQLMRGTAKNK